mgnify:CR=1 FL=1
METLGETDFNGYAKVFIFSRFSQLTAGFVCVFPWKMAALAGWLAGLLAGFLLAGWLANLLTVWLAGCLAGGVLRCVCMVIHFERFFT